MASKGGGNSKNKLEHSSGKPFERKKSFLRRVTDSIKDVLRPSWLDEDIGSNDPDSAATVVSRCSTNEEQEQVLGHSQASSQVLDHTREGQSMTEGHSKGSDTLNFSSDSSFQWQQKSGQSSETAGHAAATSLCSNSSTFSRTDSSKNYFARTRPAEGKLFQSSRGRGDKVHPMLHLSSQGRRLRPASVSAVSSAHQHRNDDRDCDSLLAGSRSSLSESLPLDNPSKRQKLWAPEMSRRSRLLQPAVDNKPAFKMDVFRSSSMNGAAHESSFYSGKTVYGGASAYRQTGLNHSLSFQNSSRMRRSVTAKPLKSSGSAVLSSSASQILKTLERLADSKRSQASDVEAESLLSFTPSSYRKRSRPLETSCSREVHTPVTSSQAKRHRADAPSAQCYKPLDGAATRSRQRENGRSSVQQKDGIGDDDDVQIIDAPALRTDSTASIALCSRSNNSVSGTSTSVLCSAPPSKPFSSVACAGTSIAHKNIAVSSESTGGVQYTFSSPVSKSGLHTTGVSMTSVKGFHFSSPVKVTQADPTSNSQSSAKSVCWSTAPKPKSMGAGNSTPVFGSNSTRGSSLANNESAVTSSTVPLKFGKTVDIMASGVSALVSSPSNIKQGSTLPVSSSNCASDSLLAKFAAPPGSWECDACMLQNKPDSTRCVACETPKPGAKHKGSSGTSSSVSTSDNLWAKFAAPSGSWECGTCMVQNKPDSTRCVACETPKPGAKQGSSSSGSSTGDNLLAKFAAPSGSWECDTCMLQNKPDSTRCAACETPRPGAGSSASATVTSNSAPVKMGPNGGLQLASLTSASSKPSPFLAAAATSKQPATGGFKFGASASDASPGSFKFGASTSDASTGGFKFGAPTSDASTGGFKFGAPTSVATTGGFKFGATTSVASTGGFTVPANATGMKEQSGFTFGASSPSSASAATGGFKLGTSGAKDTSGSAGVASGCQTATSSDDTSRAGGFQFGTKDSSAVAPKTPGFTFGASSNTDSSLATKTSGFHFGACDSKGHANTSVSSSATSTTSGFSFGSPAAVGFGVPAQCQSKKTEERNSAEKLTSPNANLSMTNRNSSVIPVCGAGTPRNSSTVGVASLTGVSSSKSLTAGNGTLSFGSAVNGESSPTSVLGSSIPSLTSAGNKQQNEGSPSKVNQFSASSSASQGFVFGSPSSAVNSGSSRFVSSSVTSGFVTASNQGKPVVNGQAGRKEVFAFGQHSVVASAGFSFGASRVMSNDESSTKNCVTEDKQPFVFGAKSVSVDKSPSEKDTDKEVTSSGNSGTFKFGQPTPVAASSTFKFGEAAGDKSSGDPTFGSQASGLGGSAQKQTGFSFSSPSNAASSTELPASQVSMFGAGAGSTNTGQFSFTVGAGPLSNAAAASPAGFDGSNSAQAFNSMGAKQSLFSFGTSETSITTPTFQFGSPQPVDSAPSQPAPGGLFGQAAQSFDSTTATPFTFSAPSAVGFGAAPDQGSFNIGTGGEARKIRRAVRRNDRK